MSPIVRWRRFDTPEDRRARLPWLAVGYVGLALLLVWDPVRNPGPSLCMMRYAFALPCPLCGLTRGVSLTLRGDPAGGTLFNPLAAPVFVVGLVLLAMWTVEYFMGSYLDWDVPGPVRLAFWAVVLTAMVATWLYLLGWRREDDFAASWLGLLLGLLRAGMV